MATQGATFVAVSSVSCFCCLIFEWGGGGRIVLGKISVLSIAGKGLLRLQ